jgi:hypothetical protein
VVHDGEQFRPVIGGIYSGPLSKEGNYEHLFGVEGEYKFVRYLVSSAGNFTTD